MATAITALRHPGHVEHDAEFIELWNRNYENFLKSAPLEAGSIDQKKTGVESITSPLRNHAT